MQYAVGVAFWAPPFGAVLVGVAWGPVWFLGMLLRGLSSAPVPLDTIPGWSTAPFSCSAVCVAFAPVNFPFLLPLSLLLSLGILALRRKELEEKAPAQRPA